MKCLDDGALRAYLDNELPEAEMCRAAGHLEACAACRERLEQLDATAKQVHAWLDLLTPEHVTALRFMPRRTATHRLPWAVLAASLTLFLALNRSSNTPVPVAPTEPAPLPALPVEPAHEAPRKARAKKPKPARPPGDFVPLEDADPMQLGMVVRVMLPVSDAQEIAADVVIGEDGRARAFRFVE